MNKTIKTILGTALGLIVASAGAHAGATFDRIKQTGVINIGFANEAPYSYRNPSGAMEGVVYEVGQIVLRKMGVKEFNGVIVQFGSLIPGLIANRYDIVVAGMAVRPERCAQIAFSEPDMRFGDTLLVPIGNPKGLNSFDDVIKTGAKIAVLQGGTSSKDVRRLGIPEAQINEFPNFPETVGALRSKRVDATVMTATTAAQTVRADGSRSFEKVDKFVPPVFDGKPAVHFSAFGFRKEDSDLVEAFNKAFVEFRGSKEHIDILKKYALSENELPPPAVTTASLCGS